MSSSGTPAILAEGLSKSFGDTQALAGLDLLVEPGSIFGLLGQNGAGKTTAVRIFTTLLNATGGKAEVAGFDVRRQPDKVREQISLAGQQATLDELLTGYENLVLLGRLQRLSGGEAKSRAEGLLEQFELTDAGGRPVKTYSGGMRRRLDLAACLIVPRSVIFLDEPTTGLDPASRAATWDAIRILAEEGASVLLTTQYLEEADRLADRIAVIARGAKIAEGSPAELKNLVGQRQVEINLVRDEDVEAATATMAACGLAPEVEIRIRRLSARAPNGSAEDLQRALQALAGQGIEVEEASLRHPTLDEAFLTLTGGGYTTVEAEAVR